MPKKAKAKNDGVINPLNYNFNQILTQKILMLSNATNQPKATVELGLHVPSGIHWSTSSDTHQVVKIWKETFTKIIYSDSHFYNS